jgi:hypothetical protein
MPNVNEGLEIDGEPVPSSDSATDPNSEAGFNALMAQKVGRSPDGAPAASEVVEERPPDPAKDTAADIRAQVASVDAQSSSIGSGLTFDTPKRSRQETARFEAKVEAGKKLLDAEAVETRAMKNELAARRYADALQDPDLTEEAGIAAAYQFSQEAPEVFQGMVAHLDDAAVDEQLAWGIDDDEFLDDDQLPGTQLNDRVELMKAHLRAYELQDTISKLQKHRQDEQMRVQREIYAREGITDPVAIQEQTLSDFATMRELGIASPLDLNPQDFAEQLELISASRATLAEAQRIRDFKNRLFYESDTSVAGGLEFVGPDGRLHPATPRPDFVPTTEKLAEQINSRVDQRLAKPMTKGDLRRAILEPDTQNWRDGLTTDGGEPTTVDIVTGAKERREQREREERARIRFLSGGRG